MRQILLLLAIVLIGQCQDFHNFVYKDGVMKYNKDQGLKSFGDFTMTYGFRSNNTVAQGMTSTKVPFYMVFEMTSFYVRGDKVTVTGECKKGAWNGKAIETMTGGFMATGTWEKMTFNGTCASEDKTAILLLTSEGVGDTCNAYGPLDASPRAAYLEGSTSAKFNAGSVLNFALFGYPYFEVLKNCRPYLRGFGTIVNETKPGYLIVGKDGAHCAMVDKEGDKFIHMNPVKKAVTINPITMLKDFFKNGYIIREYDCHSKFH